jgi:long-chain acyl-CoA synthetase
MPDVIEGQEKVLTVLPLSHSYAMTTCMNFAIAIAGAMILLPRLNTGELLETIAHNRPTIFPGTPSIYVTINQFPKVRRFGVQTIRACLSGASPLPLEVQEAFEKVTRGKLVEGYGLTEASPVTHANPIFGESKPGTIGLPLPDTEAKIVDRVTGWQVAAGEIGELIVRGPQVMRGYWNNPAQTARALRDGWLYTGDMVREDEDGYFQFVDRKSDLIEKDGITIYPRDIEEVLYEHPKVVEAAVVGLRQNEDNPLIKAYVVLRRNEKATPEEIIAFARARLPEYAVPDAVEFRSALPKTFVGKVFKRKLIQEEKEQ